MQELFDANYTDDFIPRHYAQYALAQWGEEKPVMCEEMRAVLTLYAHAHPLW
jgi:hypothetical protein